MAYNENNLNYQDPILIAPGVYWVGFYDKPSGLHCNPYVITDEDEAVIIDGGSRPDFPIVMMKILQAGVDPSKVKALIYHHYDPDLCGSLPNYENMIDRDDLKIITAQENNMFIRHYSIKSKLISLENMNYEYQFSSGRKLFFIKTPYCHSEGSFVTFDPKSETLFTSDLMASYGTDWGLFLELRPECRECTEYSNCPNKRHYCPIPDILNFHKRIMPSGKALRFALDRIMKVPFKRIAPQHGSVMQSPQDAFTIIKKLAALDGIGIDRIIPYEKPFDFDTLNRKMGAEG